MENVKMAASEKKKHTHTEKKPTAKYLGSLIISMQWMAIVNLKEILNPFILSTWKHIGKTTAVAALYLLWKL